MSFAKENIENSIRIKDAQKKELQEENRKYSPVTFKSGVKASSPESPGLVANPEEESVNRVGL